MATQTLQRVIPPGYALNNQDTQTNMDENETLYRKVRDHISQHLAEDGLVDLKKKCLRADQRERFKDVPSLMDQLVSKGYIEPKNKNYEKLIKSLDEINEKAIADHIRGSVDPAFAKQTNLVVSTESVQGDIAPEAIRDQEDFRAAAELPEALHYETYQFCLLYDDRARDRALDYKDMFERELEDVKICTPDSFPAVGGIQGSLAMAVKKSCYRILYLDEETWDSMCSKLTTEHLFVTMKVEGTCSVIPVVTTPEVREKAEKALSTLAGLIKPIYVITDREHMNAMKSFLKQAEIEGRRREEDEQKERNEAKRVALRKRAAEEKRKTDEIDEQLATLAGLQLTD
ncbi:uncharacterized protein LOC141914046 [Tubulanus polymorphus]|uniref:uncharacterized protein LOC141914046 n=1 Tax=Tubulanus polymorphus TaxID=672921 RepID=UPI003DA31BAD